MATKTQSQGSRTTIESDAVARSVTVEDNHVGTAMEVLEKLEEADMLVGALDVERDDLTDDRKITIHSSYGDDGEEQPLATALHSMLTNWGFERAGDLSYTDDAWHHVYVNK